MGGRGRGRLGRRRDAGRGLFSVADAGRGSSRLPFLLALVGIFGGLQAFGLLGLFVGPVIMAALLVVWREWLVSPPK